MSETWIVRNTGGLALDEFSKKGELYVVGHDVRWALNFALLHEELEVGHDFVLELLQPFMQFHVILISPRIVVLTPPRFAPVCLGKLECAGDLAVEDAVPLGGLTVELDWEDAWLDSQLEDRPPLSVGGAEDALLALVAPGSSTRDVAELWPWQIVGEHGGSAGRGEVDELTGRANEKDLLLQASAVAFCVSNGVWECAFHFRASADG